MSSTPNAPSKKRPLPSSNPSQRSTQNKNKRRKVIESRNLTTQSAEDAFNGEINLANFVKAREFEIRALESGIKNANGALMRRAFQDVPRDLRRRQASHNVARVPKRLRRRAAKEMAEDNTPTVNARTRQKSGKTRLRLDTVKKLRAMNEAKKKAKKKTGDSKSNEVTVRPELKDGNVTHVEQVRTPRKKPKKAQLAKPLIPHTKFRKRQMHKTWLPTHMYHTKRAQLTEPKEPLWRFAIPLTPSVKSYRPTHRATSLRSAVAWDMSYMSTIGLEGTENSISGLLKELGFASECKTPDPWGKRGQRWRKGTRTWSGWLYERLPADTPIPIAPATVIWRQASEMASREGDSKRKAFIRLHPAGFLQLWDQVIQIAKVRKPEVAVEDLRFEIGSIDVMGPASTEALVNVLWPNGAESSSIKDIWNTLSNLSNPGSLPKDVFLGFDVADPRLHHPPKRMHTQSDGISDDHLLELTVSWPLDDILHTSALFDRKSRYHACHALTSQKSINRRKALSKPGTYPEPRPTDPKIPVLLFVTRSEVNNGQAKWTIMLPWKCVLPVWCSLMYYPVSTGGTLRFGGLHEIQQVSFEMGQAWYPADFPGTKAGDAWEALERQKRKSKWERMPRGKRVEWSTLDLGTDRKGELGEGWTCDWEYLVNLVLPPKEGRNGDNSAETTQEPLLISYKHIPSSVVAAYLRPSKSPPPLPSAASLFTAKVTLVARGNAPPCARIYRLPTDPALRAQWLARLPTTTKPVSQAAFPVLPPDAPAHVNRARLAHLLLSETEPRSTGDHPPVPGAEDLVGFVTSGQFNLCEGRGTAIGSLLLNRVLEGWEKMPSNEKYTCIVRESGQKVGRLAKWEVV